MARTHFFWHVLSNTLLYTSKFMTLTSPRHQHKKKYWKEKKKIGRKKRKSFKNYVKLYVNKYTFSSTIELLILGVCGHITHFMIFGKQWRENVLNNNEGYAPFYHTFYYFRCFFSKKILFKIFNLHPSLFFWHMSCIQSLNGANPKWNFYRHICLQAPNFLLQTHK